MTDQLNYGRNWRNFQFVWWGWGPWCWRPMLPTRCEGSLASVYRWTAVLGPLEIRRWAEDYRDMRRRLERTP